MCTFTDKQGFLSSTLNDLLGRRLLSVQTGMTHLDSQGAQRWRSWSEIIEAAGRRASDGDVFARGQVVGLALPNDFRMLECLFACWMTGAIPSPLAPPGLMTGRSVAHVSRVAQASRMRHVLCASESIEAFDGLEADAQVLGVDVEVGGDALERSRWVSDPECVALVQYTSGSTSHPKGITLPHHTLLASLECMTKHYPLEPGESCVSWLPFYHDMGLVGACMQAFWLDIDFHLMEPSTFLQRPEMWLTTMSEKRATITFVNNLCLTLCLKRVAPQLVETLDLSPMKVLCLGGEPIDVAALRAFVAFCKPAGLRPEAMMAGYGLAEAVVCVTRNVALEGVAVDRVDRHALRDARAVPCTDEAQAVSIASVGPAIHGHELLVMGEAGRVCEQREVGELWVAGPALMRGYWQDPEQTARVLVEHAGRTWLRTGDLGYQADGMFYVCGRLKELIIVRGKNHHPQDIECAAERVDGVRAGQSIAFSVTHPDGGPEQVVVMCETVATDHDALERGVRREVLLDTGLKLSRVVFCPPHTLPKTSSGKRQRRRARAFFLSMGGAS